MPIYSETIKNLTFNKMAQPYYRFDGTAGQEINCGDLGFKNTNAVSVAMWINPEIITGTGGDDGGWEFHGSVSFSLGVYNGNYHCKVGNSSNSHTTINVTAGALTFSRAPSRTTEIICI